MIIFLQLVPILSNEFLMHQVISKTILVKKIVTENYYLTLQILFFLSPTVPAEVEKLIDALNIKKSTGPCSIPVFILKMFKPFFALWLSKLANLCFITGVFPDINKTAQVTPTYKKESKLIFLNYRPISLLSYFSIIFDKLIYTRIYTYLK